MCGRVRCTLRPEQVARACCAGEADAAPLDTIDLEKYRPSYNLSPGAYLPVVAFRRKKAGAEGEEEKDGERRPVLHCMKWGLVPSFTKKTEKPDHYRMFNARLESIGEKASFRRLIPNNRCLVAAEGFYEWKKDGSKKQPYYIHFKDERPLVFAALYDSWQNAEGELLYTFTILTTCSSSALQWLHDRMPVILGDKSSIDVWLNSPPSKFGSVVGPYEGPDLVWYPVTPAMGKSTIDGPECIKEIQLKPPENKPISKFFSKKIVGQVDEGQSELDVQRIHLPESTEEEPGIESVKKEHGTERVNMNKESGIGSVKEEHGTECVNLKTEPADIKNRGFTTATLVEDGEKDSEPHVSHNIKKETEICGTKRGYEQLMSGSRPSESTNNSKKKGTSKQAGVGQATLFSYFGRS